MAKLGMNDQAIVDLAGRLETQAKALDQIVGTVESLVGRSLGEWHGKDAEDFAGWWHNKHKPALQGASASVAGLAQSARNNATEQRGASHSVSGMSGTAAGTVGAAGLAAARGLSVSHSGRTTGAASAATGTVATSSAGRNSSAGESAVSAFVSKFDGKGWDFDGKYGNQCVDLFEYYNHDVVGAPFVGAPVTGGARDLYEVWPSSATNYYDRIPYTPGEVPHPGDVAVWTGTSDPSSILHYGHVAIVTNANSGGFTTLEQNGEHPAGDAYVANHSYGGRLLGFLRPKKFS